TSSTRCSTAGNSQRRWRRRSSAISPPAPSSIRRNMRSGARPCVSGIPSPGSSLLSCEGGRLPLLSSLPGGIPRVSGGLAFGLEPRFFLELVLACPLIGQSGLGTSGLLGRAPFGLLPLFRFLGRPALGRARLARLGSGAAGGLTLGI